LRLLPFLTIDGEDARDFDDAVYAEQSGSGWRLMVAIADVSYYVKPNSELDKAAYERGTSIYFPRRVIPMLPEVLSNGICSLNPQTERLCLVCDMYVTQTGKINTYQFYEAVITSQARLTYHQVWQWIRSDQNHPHKTQIDGLYIVFKKLLSERHQRGAIEFDSKETRMHFDENGKIDYIEPVIRNEAHQLIEECMLAANTCAANFITEHKAVCLYRVHEGPTPEKLDVLRKMLAFFGLDLPGGDKPEPKHYAALSEKIRLRPDAPMLEIALLRSMQQAIYSPDNKGHFGLAYQNYVHFTSPIRRYPDLLTHRVIKAILNHQLDKQNDWVKMGEHASFTERRADEASRDVEAWLKTYFMQDKIGEIFNGKISGVTGFGLFILLDDIYVEGLVHISALGKDYFHYRPEMLAIEGERSRKVYQLGDAITVQVAAANLENRQIDFALVDNQKPINKKIQNAKNNLNSNYVG
jgi:ribonuclease R